MIAAISTRRLSPSAQELQANGGDFSGARNGSQVDKTHPALDGRIAFFSQISSLLASATEELITKHDEKRHPVRCP